MVVQDMSDSVKETKSEKNSVLSAKRIYKEKEQR
jgi:hypothetical protein